MPVFQYIALNGQGERVRGNLEAADSRAAAAALRSQTLFPVKLESRARSTTADERTLIASLARFGARGGLKRFLPVSTTDKVLFLRQLALMLRTGLTLLQALEVAQKQTSKAYLARVIGRLSSAVQAGTALSEAVARERRCFPAHLSRLIASAEASGELDETLDRAAVDMERRAEYRTRLVSALIYPAIVVLVSVAVAAFLVVKVIPKFAMFFERRGAALPWATQSLVDLSAWLMQYGRYVLVGLALLAATVTLVYLTRSGRLLIDRLLLLVPVVGGLLTVSAMAQLTYTLATLLNSGLTLLESLRITAGVVKNRALSQVVDRAAEKILRGEDLAGSLTTSAIPPLVVQVASVGERTGALSTVLGELAEFYDGQLQTKIRRMSALIEPVMILVIGGMVGFVYFAFFQAVFQLATAGR